MNRPCKQRIHPVVQRIRHWPTERLERLVRVFDSPTGNKTPKMRRLVDAARPLLKARNGHGKQS